jgi:hypothetical protein
MRHRHVRELPGDQRRRCAGRRLAPNFDYTGYCLIPGVLHAYKASADDLAGYVMPTRKRRHHDAHGSSHDDDGEHD